MRKTKTKPENLLDLLDKHAVRLLTGKGLHLSLTVNWTDAEAHGCARKPVAFKRCEDGSLENTTGVEFVAGRDVGTGCYGGSALFDKRQGGKRLAVFQFKNPVVLCDTGMRLVFNPGSITINLL